MKARKSNLIELPDEARRERESESDHWWDRQHSLVLRQSPKWAQALTLALFLLGGGGIIASSVIKIDEVITITGTLKPTEGIYEVKTPAGGLIKKVSVEEGEVVKKGDLLVQFDTRAAEQEISNIQNQMKELDVSFKSSTRAINARLSAMRNSLSTNEQILEKMRTLHAVGALEENSLLGQIDRVYQLKADINEIEEELVQKESTTLRNISDLRTRLRRNEIQKQYELVYAPKSGIIFENNASEKGVLGGGDLIMKIIPQNNLKASTSVTNREIGFIRLGQEAKVRIDSFDYTKFGYVDGFVQSIGAEVKARDKESGSDYTFPVVIGLKTNFLEHKEQNQIAIRYVDNSKSKAEREKINFSGEDIFNYNSDALQQLRQ